MDKGTTSLLLLIEENQIDIFQLAEYFNESIFREEQYLNLTESFSTPKSNEETRDILKMLFKFKIGLHVFCEQNNLLPLKLTHDGKTECNRHLNALKFLLLLKKFPVVLNELTE